MTAYSLIKSEEKSDFEYEIINNIVVIYDLNLGNRSVTHNIQRVLTDIQNEIPGMPDMKIIYCDSEKIFDGVEIDEKGRFKHFYPIREKELYKAIALTEMH